MAKAKVETGEDWDEVLNLYDKGTININFYNNQIGYCAGDKVAGSVDIDIKSPFPADDLTISFIGMERVHIDVPLRNLKSFH